MKYIRVTIESFFAIPDDAEITTHDEEEFQCIKVKGECYIPTCEWLKRDEAGSWVTAGDEFEAMGELQLEGASIDESSEEEIQSYLEEDEEGL